jgi:tRNA-splicing ligase RtcB
MYASVPSGVGSSRSDLKLPPRELARVLRDGAAWAVAREYGRPEDLEHLEEGGCLPGADPALVSARALERGSNQLGTLGSGNHFAELQYVAEIYDDEAAAAFGHGLDQLTVMIHSGSRGLGHQVCDDYIDVMLGASRRYGIELPDKQLCCAPLGTREADAYMAAMTAAANFAFANRQVMTHYTRGALAAVFGAGVADATEVVYDVAHNIAKVEDHVVDGRARRLCVHRKGATRAFPPGHPELPPRYRDVGQPVLIPGDMGRYSYVLTGTQRAYSETYGSTCHGAGRLMSRHQAKKVARPRNIVAELASRGILVRAASRATVDEEIPEAYKDVADVVDVVHGAGIGAKVVRLRPVGVIKG